MNKRQQQIKEFLGWRLGFLAGTDKGVIKMWFDSFESKIRRLEKLNREYEEEKIILALCYIDGLSRFKYGLTSKRSFIDFLSNYSDVNQNLARKLYEWHRCFGVHHGKILGISTTGRLDLKSSPPKLLVTLF